jgi:hypothetical protein
MLPSVCVSVCIPFQSLLGKDSVNCIPPIVARQRLGKRTPAAANTHNSRRIVGRIVLLYDPSLIKGESVGPSVYSLSLLGNNSVKTFPRQWIVGVVVYYADRVVWKESRRLVLAERIFFFVIMQWNFSYRYNYGKKCCECWHEFGQPMIGGPQEHHTE